jgi:hypothetical protein
LGQRVYYAYAAPVGRGWDGTFHGSPAETGVYFWQITYKVVGYPESFFLKGDVTLLR